MASTHVGAALSHAGVLAAFTNRSRHTCLLYGHPGVAAVDSKGKQFEQAVRTTNGYLAGRDHGSAHDVVRQPGKAASSFIEGTAVGGGGNRQAGRALVTPPNTTKSTRVAFSEYFCSLQVHPVIESAQR